MVFFIRNLWANLSIFLIAALFQLPVALGNIPDYILSYYTVDEGLSQNEVTSVLKDKHGFMWFGTRGGLNRFDGYEFLHYKPEFQENSLTNPSIETLYSDRGGNIWIGTKGGRSSIYHYSEEVFKDIEGLPTYVIGFLEDDSGKIWAGSWERGLYEYDPASSSVSRYLPNQRVYRIIQDDYGTIWCGTSSGLFYKPKGHDQFINLWIQDSHGSVVDIELDAQNDELWLVGWGLNLVRLNIKDLSFTKYNLPIGTGRAANTYSVLLDQNKRFVWVGTWGNGLYLFDLHNKNFRYIDLKSERKGFVPDISYQVILDLLQDEAGDIWVGTDGAGVIRISERNHFRTLFSHADLSRGSFSVNCLHVDDEGNKWVGMKGYGLLFVNNKNVVTRIGFADQSLNHDPSIVVRFIAPDPAGRIWVGINEGLYVVTGREGRWQLQPAYKYFNSPDLGLQVKVLCLLHLDGKMWMGTQEHGLYLFEQQQGRYNLAERVVAAEQLAGIHSNRITSFKVDRDGRTWMSTFGGLYLFDPENRSFLLINDLLLPGLKPLCDISHSVYVDASNNLWVATPCGISRFIPAANDKFHLKTYSKKEGLSDDYVNAVYGDLKGYIWASTNSGLSRLNPSNHMVWNYDLSDGLGDMNFKEAAGFRDASGWLYFGGHSNLTFFDPAKIENNDRIANILFTEFKIFNKPVKVDPDGFLPKTINEITHLTLNHRQTEFSFQFTSLDYKSPQLNQYAYRLLGKDSDSSWVNISNRRFISFNNLPAGKYILQITGSNSNGYWNPEGRTLELKILPPPWKSWYAMVFYILVILSIVFLITRVSIKQEKLKHRIKLEQLARQKDTELNEFKLQFFTNISHEFRTPLTLISAPVNELQQKGFNGLTASFFQSRMAIVNQNVKYLLLLVNQLLEFRKMESGKLSLQVARINMVDFVKRAVYGFKESLSNKAVSISENYDLKSDDVYLDAFRFEMVLNNLLSNAYKYASCPKRILVGVSESESHVILQVGNNGPGISKGEINKIFERFYQGVNHRSVRGSGIGLSIVKGITEMHKGSVEVESEDGNTVFIIKLPKGKDHFAPEVLVENADTRQDEIFIPEECRVAVRSVNTRTKGAKILIVEDNEKVRDYLCKLLQDDYDVVEAVDGCQGYDLVFEHKPDLVITDLMMPFSDGYELCQKIKNNELLAHIPVIVLTARDAVKDELTAIRKGADAFLTKPFQPEVLHEKVKQILSSRKFLASKFRKKVVLEPLNKEITSDEERLLTKTLSLVEKNINNPNLDPEYLASNLGMSSSTFYRHMKKLLNQTPGEFIKSVRMKKAATYLRETNLTVSEIVENVGYLDIKNFRNSFKEEFGVTPADFKRQFEN